MSTSESGNSKVGRNFAGVHGSCRGKTEGI